MMAAEPATRNASAQLPVWRQIHAVLREDIERGRYGPGDRLPTEAALSARFAVNRHTLRRALGELAEDGMIHVRRGAGATVLGRPLPYPLGLRTRFGENLARAGRRRGSRQIRLETLRADTEQAGLLRLKPGDPVHVVETVGLADGLPITHGISLFPAGRFPGLLDELAGLPSISEALRQAGLPDYSRLWTRLRAARASAAQARHLQVIEGAPVLLTRSLNVDASGAPVEYGRGCFVSERVELVVGKADSDLPQPG